MYVIKRYNHPIGQPNSIYEQWLTNNSEFMVVTSNAAKFATLDLAVCHWNSIHTRYYSSSEVWVEGPRGGRYDPITGHPIRTRK